MDASKNQVIEGCNGHADLGGEPGNGITYSSASGVPDLNRITAVRVEGWANVPAVDAMGRPQGPFVGLFVHSGTDARRGNGRAVEFEWSKELGAS
jgi:hypothetical protein